MYLGWLCLSMTLCVYVEFSEWCVSPCRCLCVCLFARGYSVCGSSGSGCVPASKPSDEKPCGLLFLKRTEESGRVGVRDAGLPQWFWVERRWCWLRGPLSSKDVALSLGGPGPFVSPEPLSSCPACPRKMQSLRRRACGRPGDRLCPTTVSLSLAGGRRGQFLVTAPL